VVSIAAGTIAETQKAAFPCRIWGVAARFKGTISTFAILQMFDAAATGGGSAAKYTVSSGTNGSLNGGAAAGQGYAWFERLRGMLFRQGLTVIATDPSSVGGWDILVERAG
jgi:hypothetical protein